jgi:ATP-dependent 26S proteasome regulatory subunit
MRPGRFDRKIMLNLPDYAARIAILGAREFFDI